MVHTVGDSVSVEIKASADGPYVWAVGVTVDRRVAVVAGSTNFLFMPENARRLARQLLDAADQAEMD